MLCQNESIIPSEGRPANRILCFMSRNTKLNQRNKNHFRETKFFPELYHRRTPCTKEIHGFCIQGPTLKSNSCTKQSSRWRLGISKVSNPWPRSVLEGWMITLRRWYKQGGDCSRCFGIVVIIQAPCPISVSKIHGHPVDSTSPQTSQCLL